MWPTARRLMAGCTRNRREEVVGCTPSRVSGHANLGKRVRSHVARRSLAPASRNAEMCAAARKIGRAVAPESERRRNRIICRNCIAKSSLRKMIAPPPPAGSQLRPSWTAGRIQARVQLHTRIGPRSREKRCAAARGWDGHSAQDRASVRAPAGVGTVTVADGSVPLAKSGTARRLAARSASSHGSGKRVVRPGSLRYTVG